MGIIDTNFTMPGNDSPPQTFRDLKTQQGQINWLAQFLMSVNNVFDNVSGSVTTLAEDQSAHVEIDFDDVTNTATFDFYLPRGYRGYPGSMESVTATAQTLAPGSSATVSVTLDEPTQSLAFSFGLPEGTPATDAQTTEAVAAWIEAHPEAVTTVQDGAVSTVKLANGAVTFAKLASDVKAILAGKADLVAYAPLLTAGVAESLLSGDEQTATFTQRTSDHDGSVGVRALMGNTVVWNQLAIQRDPSVIYDGELTITTSTGKVVFNGTLTNEVAKTPVLTQRFNIENGHKYYVNTHQTTIAYYVNVTGGWTQTAAPKIITAGASENNGQIHAVVPAGGMTFTNFEFIPQLIDLTLMFGAGNEPATVAEFEALYPEAYYPYNAGELVSVNVEGIESAGVTREIPANTYFPTGIKSAGTVHDELHNDKAITRIGSRAYQSGDESDTSVITDGTTTTYYALSTPVVVDIDPPINMDYLTQAGGTEQIVIPSGEQSAAPTFVYVQGYDANGVVDKVLSVIAPLEGAKASTNYAIGSYFVHDGKLYKATSAIASGETITPGTNCTQTTVMAEILALG